MDIGNLLAGVLGPISGFVTGLLGAVGSLVGGL